MVSSYAAAAIGAMVVEVCRGALIVLEGLDCSGKSLQPFDLLLAYPRAIRGGLVFLDHTIPMGKMISSYLSSQMDLDDASIHLLFSANRWEKQLVPLPKNKT